MVKAAIKNHQKIKSRNNKNNQNQKNNQKLILNSLFDLHFLKNLFGIQAGKDEDWRSGMGGSPRRNWRLQLQKWAVKGEHQLTYVSIIYNIIYIDISKDKNHTNI